MATLIDTSLYKLNKNAFSILSGAYAKMPEIASDAIDAYGSPKQPKLDAELIHIGVLADQIAAHVVLNTAGDAIIGIKNEDVSVINTMLMCLRDIADLGHSNHIPSPLIPPEFDECCTKYDVGPIGSILVSDGETYHPVSPSVPGSVPVWDGAQVVWSTVVGNGLPAGGLAGQVLKKNSNSSYDAIWATPQLADLQGVTTTVTELNSLHGLNAGITATQFNTLLGINTGQTIQQQIDGKMSNTLTNGRFFVGNSSNVATEVAPTGDVVFNNAGVFAISSNVIVDADINVNAGIARTKLAAGTSWRMVINGADGKMTDANGIAPAKALISDGNGIPVASITDATRLGYINTLESNAQDQLNQRLTVNLTPPVNGDILKYNGTDWVNMAVGAAGQVLTSDGITVVWGSAAGNGLPSGGTAHQILRKIDNANYNTEWHDLIFGDITDVATSAAEINLLVGLLVNAAHLNYTADVTSPIQAQLDNKLPIGLGINNLYVGGPGNTAIQKAPGVEGSVFTIVGGSPVWQTPPTPGNVTGPVSSTDNAIVRWNGTSGISIQDSGLLIDDSNNLSGVASISSGPISLLNQASIQLLESGGANFVGIRASAAMGADYTITLPAAAPASGNALVFNGTDYVWSPAGSGVVAFTDLSDAPHSYAGAGGLLIAVKGDLSGLEFVAASGTVGSVGGTVGRITSTGGTNPVIDIDPAYIGQNTITTLGTVTAGTWQGAVVGLAYGGTGVSLTSPGADRIMFWDQSANSVAFLTAGSGLAISGTTITATGSYTDAQAQAAVGSILQDSSQIGFTYNAGIPYITAIVKDHSISAAKFRQSVALSVVGNPTNALADVTDIAAASDFQVLGRSGTTLAFGAVNLASSNAVTNVLSIANGGTGGTAYTFLSLTDTPDTYAGQANKFVVVKPGADGLEFISYAAPYALAKEVPVGAIDGVNTVYTLSFTPSPGSESVYLSGQMMEGGVGNDYTISGNTITFVEPPQTTDKLVVVFGGSTGWVGITDGNKGDINVTSTGTTWTINNGVVTYAKIQNVTQNRFLGRISTGAGPIEELTGAQATSLLDTFSYTLKGLVPNPGGSGTTRFLREDGQWQVPGGGGGGLPPDGTYSDIQVSGTGTSWNVLNGKITYAKMQAVAALAVVGNPTASAAAPTDIAAATDGHVLRRAGLNLGFGTIATAGITNAAVTYAKIQAATGLSVLGNATNGTLTLADIVAANDAEVLRRSGTSLGFGQIATGGITNAAVTYAKIQDVSATNRIMGRIAAGVGPMQELNGTQATSLLDNFTYTTKGLVPNPGGSGSTRYLREDGTWQTPGGASFTNGAALNEMMKSDGTNGVASGIFSSTLGNVDLGGSATGGVTRTIQAAGSGSNISITMNTKGTGSLAFQAFNGNISANAGVSFSAIAPQVLIGSNTAAADVVIVGSSASVTQIVRTSSGDASFNDGRNLTFQAGSAYGSSGNGNGGSIIVASGTKFGAGIDGTITLDSKTQQTFVKSYDFTLQNNTNARNIVFATTVGSLNSITSSTTLQLVATGGNLEMWTGNTGFIRVKNSANSNEMLIYSYASQAIISTNSLGLNIVANAATLQLLGADVLVSAGSGNLTLNITAGGNLFMTGLKTSSAGLPSGAIWRDAAASHVLKMVP